MLDNSQLKKIKSTNKTLLHDFNLFIFKTLEVNLKNTSKKLTYT
jgi:hypothetical protein